MALRGPPEDRSPAELLSFGVLNLDKPPGPSAHQVAAWVRDLATVDRAAHAGTLDPKVTGCLPMLLGDATRMAQVFDDSRKEYVAVLELHERLADSAALEAIADEFEGEIYQKPPKKSAVVRRLRSREIHSLDVLEAEDRRVLLSIRCESGTYIRKLCHDMGLALGTGAHMGDLRRAATDPFEDSDLVTMHDFVDALAWWREDDDPQALREVVQPAERALVDLPSVTIAPSAAESVAEGAPVYAPGVIDADDGLDSDAEPLVACYIPNGAAVCLGTLVGDPDSDEGTVVDLERVLV
ncbi:putative tRNA pseudouridine synthase B protein [Halorhabdus tiamatea SARL4B]|uniref:Probable tRNA pseudouridine synthase B n=1 Tax=Halorhabdus tiamatea SARL4B TaxID=1033806 RepID=F7PPK8_9EURY|nr:RNA-guided pseudouridylation complex pseudouridine synthase subunit Cbf5 [Halorhabdus tiamatea]ERJ06183.1 putative tRNA pseudouridine synthase B protein [Halorhabdus tiamatea SARL4B]CCQ34040.1 tRNA pseudouridine 55 synthase [Halorhabdus tiamatea SARL4B]